MSGLVLLAALCAVVFFVVEVKFTGTMLLGIPTGEAAVFMMIMTLVVAMLAIYCKHFEGARNVFLWYVGTGIIVAALSWFGIPVPGMAYFLFAIGVSLLYCVLLMFKTKARNLIITVGTAVISIAFLFSVNYAFTSILQPHQQMRIKVALGIEEDLRGAGYNVNQSKIAIGSGGIWGKGFLNGTQTKLKYVPEQHTDFIYCTIGEEEGFIGAAGVLLLFLILILRIISLAERQPTVFGRVYAYCVASYLIFHISTLLQLWRFVTLGIHIPPLHPPPHRRLPPRTLILIKYHQYLSRLSQLLWQHLSGFISQKYICNSIINKD